MWAIAGFMSMRSPFFHELMELAKQTLAEGGYLYNGLIFNADGVLRTGGEDRLTLEQVRELLKADPSADVEETRCDRTVGEA